MSAARAALPMMPDSLLNFAGSSFSPSHTTVESMDFTLASRGSKSSGPACATPPPMTKASGFNSQAMLASAILGAVGILAALFVRDSDAAATMKPGAVAAEVH